MTLKHKVLLTTFGITFGMAVKYLVGPSIETFGTDFTPPAPMATSLKISGFFSNDRNFQEIDNQLNHFIEQWNIAGASVAIAKDGKMVFAKGYGLADKENVIKAEPYHLYRVASVSKLITAVGIMKLVEEGKISLDQKVFGPNGILNEGPYNNYLDNRVESIEVVHLLNHSAGWTNRWGDPMFMPTVIAEGRGQQLPVSDKDIISFMLGKRLHFTPGTTSSYSNLGYAILGKVIEQVSQQDYESYIKTNILYPLGIFDMRLGGSYPDERAQNEVKYYEPDDNDLVDDFSGNGQKVKRSYGGNDIHTLGSAGGWIASATDLLKLMLAIDGLPVPQDILNAASVEKMTNPGSPGLHPLGWRGTDSLQWYRTGTLAGTSTLMVRREDGMSYVILLNSSSWKGALLPGYMRSAMDRSISKTESWPERDLFELASGKKQSVSRNVVVF
jgi:CubicO group peptidase (beta-lactamase class C family)